MAVTEKQIMEALSTVMDPELKRDLVSLGMIKNVAIDGGKVSLTVELTTPACPLKDTIRTDVEKAVKAVDGVESVAVEFSSRVRQAEQQTTEENLIPDVKNTILVGSGKGGVGKSTVALNIAVALRKEGAKVGLLDADVYGPSMPTMLGARNQRPNMHPDKEMIQPLNLFDLKVMSVGFLMEEGQPVIWRGPLLSSLITQFLRDVDWGELDYLIVDLPPGTGDVQLTFAQKIKATGAVLVTTPQDVALADVYRAKYMFDKVDVPVLGIVENMSSFICPDCGAIHEIFKGGGADKASKELGISTLGKIPIHSDLSAGCDRGVPAVWENQETEYAKALLDAARNLAGKVSQTVIEKTDPVH